MLNATSRRGRAAGSPGMYVLASALILAVFVAPFALAAGEGNAVRGGKRNPSANKSLAYSAETQILTSNSTYGTRQSNKGSGGGAVYGCRSALSSEACIRANNLKSGRAFTFQTTSGNEAGFIRVGKATPNPTGVPFNTNAAGRVANLNADRVDDLHASEIVAQAKDLWAVVTTDGGLSRKNAAASSARLAAGEYEVVFDRDVTACAYNVTLGSADTAEAPAGEAGASQRAGNVRGVAVVTRDSAGVKADRPFHLTVNC